MDKQVIIAIGREFCSEGSDVGMKLAERLGIQYYDRNLLDEFADQNDLNAEELQKYDEKPKFKFMSRTVRGYSNNPMENIMDIQSALLKSKAVDEDSFVIVGRCADEILKEFDCLITVFISSNHDVRIKHTMEKFHVSEKEAEKLLIRHDKYRRSYHDHFSKNKWGEAGTYDICINASKLGVDATVDALAAYVERRLGLEK